MDTSSSTDHLPTGTVTFLFTDIEGSTALAQNYPDQMPALLERHNSILRQSIQAFQGIIFQFVGDAYCAAFYTPIDAVNAALTAQQSLQHEAWDPTPVRVRMGIHTGTAQANVMDDRSIAYSGYLALAHTQGVMSGAHGGQVLLSSASAGLVHDNLPQGVSLRDLGEHRLKGEINPEQLWQIVAGNLQAEFPPLKTLRVLPNNLPVQVNRFVGRENELKETNALLEKTHLLTLIGPGGTGKTRLAIQLAGEVLASYANGAWLVELASLADPALVLQTVAGALGLRQNPGADLYQQLADFLCAKTLLLILDNCEHLIESCALLADRLLHHCANLKILASSREALGISGETVYRVPPLGLPKSDQPNIETLSRSEAVQLFVERAAAVKAGFGLSEHNAGAIAQICRRLDGIPLALELAAARVVLLTPKQIATRLDDRFRLLTGGSRTALPRQQTLRSLIDWSYDLLSDRECILFCQLSVFVGGWSLEAAEAVCTDPDTLEVLTQLVLKSIVVAEELEDSSATRFRMLETIRQYARDKLLERGMVEQVRDRHLEYYLRFAETGELNTFSPSAPEWLNRCELEKDNFRAALQWGLESNIEAALRLSGSLPQFWIGRGFTEGRRWLQAALDRAAILTEPTGEAARKMMSAQAKAWLGLGQVSYGDGNYPSGLESSQQALALYTQLGDRFNQERALCQLGNMLAFQGDLDGAEMKLNEAIQLCREHDNKLILCYATGVLSNYVYLQRGDISRAAELAKESVFYAREIGAAWAEAQGELVLANIAAQLGQWDEAQSYILAVITVSEQLHDPALLNLAYTQLGDIELRADNLLEAEQHCRRAIQSWQKLEQDALIAHELENFAYLARIQEKPERAARLLSAAEAVQERIGTTAVGVVRLQDEYERTIDWLHSRLSGNTFTSLWSEGCSMTTDQAIAYALEQ